MSMTALKWARDVDPSIGLCAKAVLRDLADRANDTGVCWPSLSTIASDSGMHRRSVSRALRKLESEGLLKTKQIPGRGSRYVLCLPAEPMTESHDTHGRESRPHDSLPPKASKSLSEANLGAHTPKTSDDGPRMNAGAYKPFDPDDMPPDIVVDEDVLEQARDWLNGGPR